MYTKEALKDQLKAMGIRPTDKVVIHTSMHAIGPVEDGPDGVIDVFREYLTEGLLIVPTHTWHTVTPEKPLYDVRKTPSGLGIIPATAAFRKDGIRSLHPTHSMWVSGRGAEDYIRGEETASSPTPVGYAWDRLADVGAKILLIGVDNRKNTFIHAIDEHANLPDRIGPTPDTYTVIDYDGSSVTNYQNPLLCSKTEDISWFYDNFEGPLTETGVQKFGKFGNAVVRYMDAMEARNLIMKIYSRATEDIFPQHIEIPKSWYKD